MDSQAVATAERCEVGAAAVMRDDMDDPWEAMRFFTGLQDENRRSRHGDGHSVAAQSVDLVSEDANTTAFRHRTKFKRASNARVLVLAGRLHGGQREGRALVLVRGNAAADHAFNNTALLGYRSHSDGEKPKENKRLPHRILPPSGAAAPSLLPPRTEETLADAKCPPRDRLR